MLEAYVTCDNCGGSGECPKCDGTGFVQTRIPGGLTKGRCPECKGDCACDDCKGTGKR